MKKSLKFIISIIIALILIIVLVMVFDKNKAEENEEIDELKNHFGIEGNQNIYEVINVTNGEQILNVKEDVKFKVALAGMLKQSQPTFEECDKIVKENQISKNGIYVNNSSRERFLNLISKFTEGNYDIDEKGYLKVVDEANGNENDKKLRNIINSEELVIIDFSDICYTVDEVSGEIIDYPFELMDPYQIYQLYKQGNQTIVFVNTNSKGKLNDKEIFNELLILWN